MLDRYSKMNVSEGLNNTQTSSSSGVAVSPLTERQQKVLKNELKNLRWTIVDSLTMYRLQEIIPTLSLLAHYKCDPTFKYPSFDFVPMLLFCCAVSYSAKALDFVSSTLHTKSISMKYNVWLN